MKLYLILLLILTTSVHAMWRDLGCLIPYVREYIIKNEVEARMAQMALEIAGESEHTKGWEHQDRWGNHYKIVVSKEKGINAPIVTTVTCHNHYVIELLAQGSEYYKLEQKNLLESFVRLTEKKIAYKNLD